MSTIDRFKLREWLVPPILVPLFLAALIAVAALSPRRAISVGALERENHLKDHSGHEDQEALPGYGAGTSSRIRV
jgi:hypothetical protein